MSILRQTAAVLVMLSATLPDAACRDSSPGSQAQEESAAPRVAAIGAPARRQPPRPASIGIDPRSGREIYLPTGETVDEVIPVRASRHDDALSVERSASASRKRARAALSDAGAEAPLCDGGRLAT